MGNLGALFSLAYDRGGKVVEMIHNRLGDERFFAFFRKVYHDYAFETFHYADLKRELVAFDPSGDWADVPRRLADRARRDRLGGRAGPGRAGRRRPTRDVGRSPSSSSRAGRCSSRRSCSAAAATGDLRVPIWPDRGSYEVPGAQVAADGRGPLGRDGPRAGRADAGRWSTPTTPCSTRVPDNNRWKPEIAWRFTPLMTPLDESSQFQAYDRLSVVAGPFIDQYARGRLQGRRPAGRTAGRSTVWAGTEPALREAIFGGQFDALPLPLAEVVGGRLLRGRPVQLLQRQAALGRPGLPPLPVPGDVQLPRRRPGVLRALLRHRQRVLGRATTAGR